MYNNMQLNTVILIRIDARKTVSIIGQHSLAYWLNKIEKVLIALIYCQSFSALGNSIS